MAKAASERSIRGSVHDTQASAQPHPPLYPRHPQTLPIDGVSRFGQLGPFLPCSRETWRKLVLAKRAPQPIKIGERCTVYRNSEVHAWLADPAGYRAEG